MTVAVDVIEEPQRAHALLQRGRIELLENLEQPASAAALARKLGQPRQRINYHLRELEAQRLVELVQEKRRGNVTERIYRRVGERYVISTAALGELGSTPEATQDRFSSDYQIALAAQAIREMATMKVKAEQANKKLPTFALQTEVRFASAEQRAEFADELATAIGRLVEKYHDAEAPGGRPFRFYLGAYPRPKSEETD